MFSVCTCVRVCGSSTGRSESEDLSLVDLLSPAAHMLVWFSVFSCRAFHSSEDTNTDADLRAAQFIIYGHRETTGLYTVEL